MIYFYGNFRKFPGISLKIKVMKKCILNFILLISIHICSIEQNGKCFLIIKKYSKKQGKECELKAKQKKSKSKPKQKKRGRKRILRAFEETTIGYNIKLRAPLEYDLIMNFSGAGEQPEADLIEAIGYASLNPYFRTTSFRKLLIKYRQNGCYQTRPKKPASSQQVRKHIEIRRNRAKNSTSKT